MTLFTLSILDGTRMILSTEGKLAAEELRGAQQALALWRETKDGVLVIAQCRVLGFGQADVELVVPPAESPHERELADERARAIERDDRHCLECRERDASVAGAARDEARGQHLPYGDNG